MRCAADACLILTSTSTHTQGSHALLLGGVLLLGNLVIRDPGCTGNREKDATEEKRERAASRQSADFQRAQVRGSLTRPAPPPCGFISLRARVAVASVPRLVPAHR